MELVLAVDKPWIHLSLRQSHADMAWDQRSRGFFCHPQEAEDLAFKLRRHFV